MYLFLTETKDWTSISQKHFQTTLQQIVPITEMVFPIAKAFSTVVEEIYWMQLWEQSERAFEYLA